MSNSDSILSHDRLKKKLKLKVINLCFATVIPWATCTNPNINLASSTPEEGGYSLVHPESSPLPTSSICTIWDKMR